jgi:hypothetical protein
MTVVTTNEKRVSQHIIELSSVYFYEGTAPRVIALKDCDLFMKSPIPGAFSALYGYRKQEGFMAARAYADQHRLQFTVIDFLVKLEHRQNPLTMKPEDLGQHDFIAFQRVSRSMMDELQDILRKRLEQEGTDLNQIDLSKPHQLIMRRPELVTTLIDEPGWEHLKVIAYLAKVAFSDKPLNVGTVPYRHWSAIQEATCRLNPNIQITLDLPGEREKNVSPSVLAPENRDRGPRMK